MAELTGKTISELPSATTLADADLLPISAGGISSKITGQALKNAIAESYTESSGSAGYFKLGSGLLVQFGYASATIASGSAYADVEVTYPVAFHANTISPLVIPANIAWGAGTSSQANVCIPTAVNLSGTNKLTKFTLRVWKQQSVGTANNPEPVISWIAIGSWK